MKLTSNYSLKKPDGSDVVNVQDFNDNSDKIDIELKKVDSSLKEIANQVDNIKIADGTTTQKGIVKLNTAINSTSTTEATTPSATKQAYDKGVEALNKANEAFTSASNGKSVVAGKVGNVSGNNTFNEIANRIQTDKNTAATNLSNKGVSASGNETLASLVGKIANISITQKISGTIPMTDIDFSITINNLPFTPDYILVTNNHKYIRNIIAIKSGIFPLNASFYYCDQNKNPDKECISPALTRLGYLGNACYLEIINNGFVLGAHPNGFSPNMYEFYYIAYKF
ncbi:tail fiber protein [Clostridium sp. ZS1]|uniref:tail fiber protein n=1 Tax=Clostridium sp. ZS1 TaxID=2949989 RepID=UPI00207A4E9A|nr:tail fiber protein [Clostridium sp. ZS1]